MPSVGWVPASFWLSPAMQAADPEIVFFGPMPDCPRDYSRTVSVLPPPRGVAAYVYILMGCDGAVLYVGKARKPGLRFESHRKRKEWWREVQNLLLVRVHGATIAEADTLALHVEGLGIRKLAPIYNIAGINKHHRGLRGGVMR